MRTVCLRGCIGLITTCRCHYPFFPVRDPWNSQDKKDKNALPAAGSISRDGGTERSCGGKVLQFLYFWTKANWQNPIPPILFFSVPSHPTKTWVKRGGNREERQSLCKEQFQSVFLTHILNWTKILIGYSLELMAILTAFWCLFFEEQRQPGEQAGEGGHNPYQHKRENSLCP